MEVRDTNFDDAKVIIPVVFEDYRGHFKETYHLEKYIKADLWRNWAQDGVSFSKKQYTLRGLHYQFVTVGMAKLVQVLQGTVFDVIVDARVNSPTYKQWQGFELSSYNHHQLLVPEGFYHGFLTLSDDVIFTYKMSELYNAKAEKALHYLSEDINIDWPIPKFAEVTISEKDAAAPKFFPES